MKKKILKALALALCFTMLFSVAAFAADSPDTGNNSGIETPTGEETSKNEGETSKNEGETSKNEGETSKNEGETSKNEGETSKNENETSTVTENETSTTAEPETVKPADNTPAKGKLDELADGVTAGNVVINGKTITVTIAKVTEAVASSAEYEAKKVGENVGKDLEVFKLFDVKLSESDDTKGIKIKFDIEGIQAGQTVYVLHQKADGSWEQLDNEVANNSVTATFESFSPVAIVVPKAPSTGDDSSKAAPLIALAAVIALAGAAVVVCKKKISVI
ncbi:MAG: LPXTG cell wall anchor domain-containing protein [Butyrivibrio sp.]|nr:LPXTG cell wall anchor domain-containing protein [Butyrivibrio sp.]